MDIISYIQFETDTKIERTLSKLHKDLYQSGFAKNPTLTRYISKLSEKYNRWKGIYIFPTKYKGTRISGR